METIGETPREADVESNGSQNEEAGEIAQVFTFKKNLR